MNFKVFFIDLIVIMFYESKILNMRVKKKLNDGNEMLL